MHGIVHNLLKANSAASKMSRKEHNERKRRGGGGEHKRLRSGLEFKQIPNQHVPETQDLLLIGISEQVV